MAVLLTVGHGTLDQPSLGALLRGAGVERLVDVRSAPGSRRMPHVARGELERWLPEWGVEYRHEPRLGGFRRPAPDSVNVALRHPSFRGYADHMRGEDFRAAIDEVLAGAAGTTTAVMCSESVWWRCHRRLIADWVTLRAEGWSVEHLMSDGRRREHRLTDSAHAQSGHVVYDLYPIEVVPYREEWPAMFERVAAELRNALGDELVEIHHVGSTSVPGLAAKPLIDVLPVVRSTPVPAEARARLEELGYLSLREYGLPGRDFFVRPRTRPREVNCHIWPQGHPDIGRHLAFRDLLRSDAALRDRYASLKRDLAARHGHDLFAYTDAKTGFIESALGR